MGVFSALRAQDTLVEAVAAVTEDASVTNERVKLHGRLSLAGKLQPHIVKFYIDPQKLQLIGKELLKAIDLVDVLLLIVFGLFTIRIGRIFFRHFEKRATLGNASTHSVGLTKQLSSKKCIEEPVDDYLNSLTYVTARMLQQVARLAALVYCFDCILVVGQVLGFEIAPDGNPSTQFAKILYSTWAFFTLKEFKRYLLGVAINRKPNKLGKAAVCDRVIDVLIYSSWVLNTMDTINFQVGPGLGSLFAFGGLGTFVFGMASKDMAAQIVSGITLTTSEKFHIGEYVRLGDGTEGTVQSMGWLYTDLRCSNETVVKIPNTQLANLRISNISRISKCQVKASLRISYGDVKKIPNFCATLKQRLIDKCPALISDGSRPFRVNWRGFREDHLLVVLDTHHLIKPIGNSFFVNQEAVLEIVSQVAEECEITFSLPLYNLNLNGGQHASAGPLDTNADS